MNCAPLSLTLHLYVNTSTYHLYNFLRMFLFSFKQIEFTEIFLIFIFSIPLSNGILKNFPLGSYISASSACI